VVMMRMAVKKASGFANHSHRGVLSFISPPSSHHRKACRTMAATHRL
jgi:hypothetical protein